MVVVLSNITKWLKTKNNNLRSCGKLLNKHVIHDVQHIPNSMNYDLSYCFPEFLCFLQFWRWIFWNKHNHLFILFRNVILSNLCMFSFSDDEDIIHNVVRNLTKLRNTLDMFYSLSFIKIKMQQHNPSNRGTEWKNFHFQVVKILD